MIGETNYSKEEVKIWNLYSYMTVMTANITTTVMKKKSSQQTVKSLNTGKTYRLLK